MNLCPGLCVIMNGGLDASATAWGVTPHAQKTGTSPRANSCASPQSGRVMSVMPMAAGSPTCTGAPWAPGNRALAVTAVASCAAGIGPAEPQESVRVIPREHGELGLDVILAETRGDPHELSVSDVLPDLPRMARVDRHTPILPLAEARPHVRTHQHLGPLAAQDAQHPARDLHRRLAGRLPRDARHVRGAHDVLEVEDRIVPGRGLVLPDVEAGGGELAAGQRLEERPLVLHGAARGVDEDGARLHEPDGLLVDHVLRLGREGRVTGKHVYL